jgi:hypothetical protein
MIAVYDKITIFKGKIIYPYQPLRNVKPGSPGEMFVPESGLQRQEPFGGKFRFHCLRLQVQSQKWGL